MNRGSRVTARFQEVSAMGLSAKIWALLPDCKLAEGWKRRIPDGMGATRENGEDKDAMREDQRALSTAENRHGASSDLIESHGNSDG
jgi:hypothetical protein